MVIYTDCVVVSIGGDGSRGYNLYSIPASVYKVMKAHGKMQSGEEVMLEVINSQELSAFSERCLLQSRRERT